VLIDHTNQRVLEVLESREKKDVVRWLRAARVSGLLSQVEEVTCDMWDAYVEAAKEVFGPKVRITIDRFHVMKNFQDRLTDARRQIQKGLNPEQARTLKGSRWLWSGNPENLTPDERARLNRLKTTFPDLGRLADHREALRQIFEDRQLTTPAIAMAHLWSWYQSGTEMGLKALQKFNQTLRHWIDKIANYVVTRSTNARTEGFNRGLRSILWRACGMQNFQHFRLRVLHLFG
jgi:transposase